MIKSIAIPRIKAIHNKVKPPVQNHCTLSLVYRSRLCFFLFSLFSSWETILSRGTSFSEWNPHVMTEGLNISLRKSAMTVVPIQ